MTVVVAEEDVVVVVAVEVVAVVVELVVAVFGASAAGVGCSTLQHAR